MSRYCGTVNAAPILAAAERWRDSALLNDASVFSDQSLWTLDGLRVLETHFIQNPDEGSDSYWKKLRSQLESTKPAVKQLAAEMNWLMLLCPSNIHINSKRQTIRDVWEWSAEPVPQSANQWLGDSVLNGIGSAGAGYNNHRWRELRFCINLCLAFKRLPAERRAELLADGWKFAEWLQNIPESESRQLRHMVVFLLFPDSFERIFGGGDRKAVVLAFGGVDGRAFNAMSSLDIDRTLRRIRGELEVQYATAELDYYHPPLEARWRQPDFRTTTRDIKREHVLRALAEIDEGNTPDRSNSTLYDLLYCARRYPPKLVLSLAAKHASGEEYDREAFTGGETSPAFGLLRDLGFEIVPKKIIRELIEKFLAQAQEKLSQSVAEYPKQYRNLDLKVSFGFGEFARVPWISFLGPNQLTSKGIYPVLLLFKEFNVLILAYGLSETNPPELHWQNVDSAKTVKQYFSDKHGRSVDKYGNSLVAVAYELPNGLDIDALTEALDEMIDSYRLLFREVRDPPPPPMAAPDEAEYSMQDALEDLFLPERVFSEMISRLRRKKNLILQGPPGVGKTFLAKRVAYALIGRRAPLRVGMVQFHQAYSYEDFVQGYRPSGTGFHLKNGVFYEFCKRAQKDQDQDYVFIIDEINRANLSKVFGELMMLVEGDKRGREWEIPLTYSQSDEDKFFVPPNVYLVGLMNTADRSLAMVDYALRRRFAFMDVQPGFETEQFAQFMRGRGVTESVIGRIIQDMCALNLEIRRDKSNLGDGFCIGHSFFCPSPETGGQLSAGWYQDIIRSEVLPLLREYWFDDPTKMDDWEQRLLGD